jgi:hypothetical protein
MAAASGVIQGLHLEDYGLRALIKLPRVGGLSLVRLLLAPRRSH